MVLRGAAAALLLSAAAARAEVRDEIMPRREPAGGPIGPPGEALFLPTGPPGLAHPALVAVTLAPRSPWIAVP